MAYQFKFPDVGEGITEGTIVKWKVKVGDHVKADQPVADIETDKAIVEIPCPKPGKISKMYHKEGEVIKVGEILVEIDDGSDSSSGSLAPPKNADAAKAKDSQPEEHYTGSVVGFLEEAKEETVAPPSVHKDAKEGNLATPKVRALAKQLGVDIESVKGSGPGGRVTEEDIQNALNKQNMGSAEGDMDVLPLKGLRKAISTNMTISRQNTVPVTNMHDLDVTKLWDLRNMQKIVGESRGIKLTFMPYFVKAVVAALKNNPIVNSSMGEDKILLKKNYNIGIAVDTDDGLMVPVIKDADKKQLLEVAQEIGALADKAKKRTIAIDELKGGTFTITNLGSLGVKYFTPVINFPEAAILGIGAITEQTVPEDGKLLKKKIMPVSFTYDHRIIDGANAARFINNFATILDEANFKI